MKKVVSDNTKHTNRSRTNKKIVAINMGDNIYLAFWYLLFVNQLKTMHSDTIHINLFFQAIIYNELISFHWKINID